MTQLLRLNTLIHVDSRLGQLVVKDVDVSNSLPYGKYAANTF